MCQSYVLVGHDWEQMQRETFGESGKLMQSLWMEKELGKRTENDTQVDEEDVVVISNMP